MRLALFDQVLKPTFPQSSRLYRDLKPGLREYLLRTHLPMRLRPGVGAEIELRLREADRICELLGKRHIRAYHAEKEGRVKEAIGLYEQNVQDCDLSTLSYERLRALYLSQGQRGQAQRVCESYLIALDELADLDPDLPDWAIMNRSRFSDYLAELRNNNR